MKNNIYNLKSKNKFKSLFEKGAFFKKKSIGLRYLKKDDSSYFIGYAVSKKNFAKAVDRNLIKRRMRSELFALKKNFIESCSPGFYLFYYLGKKTPLSIDVSDEIILVFKEFNQNT